MAYRELSDIPRHRSPRFHGPVHGAVLIRTLLKLVNLPRSAVVQLFEDDYS